jgi:hypothetical protein
MLKSSIISNSYFPEVLDIIMINKYSKIKHIYKSKHCVAYILREKRGKKLKLRGHFS